VLPSSGTAYGLAFTPDGRWLATCPGNEPVGLWPLKALDGPARSLGESCINLAIDPTGRQVLVGTLHRGVALYPFQGGAPRRLTEAWARWYQVAFDPEGRRAVAVPGDAFATFNDPASRVLRVWDLPSGKEQVHSLAHLTDAEWLGWRPGSRDGRLLLVRATRSQAWGAPGEELLLFDLTADTSRRITTHGARIHSGSLAPSGRVVVTGGEDGVVRVGPVTGEEPHLLIGHKGPVIRLAVSPDERWIASSSDESISIWPMPDVTKPPLHTLPHAELMARLDALTNVRVVRDPSSATGWREEIAPFTGWRDVPTWQSRDASAEPGEDRLERGDERREVVLHRVPVRSSSRVRPATRERASLACSIMCRTGNASSRCDIEVLGLAQHAVSEVGAEAPRQVHVGGSAEHCRQSRLQSREREEGHPRARLELHQDVDVARGREVLPQDGAEERQSPDPVATAELVRGARDARRGRDALRSVRGGELLGAGGMGEVYRARDTRLAATWPSRFCTRTSRGTRIV
jgi:WD40 repeat protein